MNTFIFLGIVDTGAALQHIIQLVILCIPLVMIPIIIQSRNAILNKIGNVTSSLQKGIKLDKGLGAIQGGGKGFVKNRALNMEARMAGAGLDDNGKLTANGNSARARAFRRIGSVRTNKKFKQDNRGRERDRMLQNSLTARYGEENTKRADRARASAAGVGGEAGQERIQAYFAGQAVERFNESIKLEEAKISSSSTQELERILRSALNNPQLAGSQEKAYAASKILAEQRGASGAKIVQQAVQAAAGTEAAGDSDTSKLAAGVVRSNGAKLSNIAPEAVKWATMGDGQTVKDNSGADVKATLDNIAGSAKTYSGQSAEKVADWSTETIINAQAAMGTASAADRATLKQTLDVALRTPATQAKLGDRLDDIRNLHSSL